MLMRRLSRSFCFSNRLTDLMSTGVRMPPTSRWWAIQCELTVGSQLLVKWWAMAVKKQSSVSSRSPSSSTIWSSLTSLRVVTLTLSPHPAFSGRHLPNSRSVR